MTNKIFITGSAGCIGHYIIEDLCNLDIDYHLYLLIRNPKKLHKKFHNNKKITIIEGSLEEINKQDSLQKIDNLTITDTNQDFQSGRH